MGGKAHPKVWMKLQTKNLVLLNQATHTRRKNDKKEKKAHKKKNEKKEKKGGDGARQGKNKEQGKPNTAPTPNSESALALAAGSDDEGVGSLQQYDKVENLKRT